MTRAIALASALTAWTPATADVFGTEIERGESWVSLAGTHIELRQTDQPGAVAEVTIFNREVNGSEHNGTYVLRWQDVEAELRFTWNWSGDPDLFEVEAPGLTARPPALNVPQNGHGVICLYPGAVGM